MRCAIYFRVSGKEQLRGYSLDAQIRALEDHCKRQGWEIVARYPEPAKSARSDDASRRPAFKQMLADAEAGQFEAVLVHKLDRFARNLRVQLDGFERLSKARVGFVSLTENMEMLMAQMGAHNQFYSDNLSLETKKGKNERKRQGLYNGHLPFGVTKGPTGVPELDWEARWCDVATQAEIRPADGLGLAFELAAAGKTDREIAQALNQAGYRSSGNRGTNAFTKDTVRPILLNRFYVGDLPDGDGGYVPGKHGALVDPALFARAQAARSANTKPRWSKTATRSPWALSGIATCGRCGKPVVADGRGRVCCAGRSQGNECSEPSYLARIVEEQMAGYLAGFAVPDDMRARFLTAWRRDKSRDVDVVAKRRRLEATRERVKELFLAGDIDRAEYQTRKAKLAEEVASLPSTVDPDSEVGPMLMGFLANVADAWKVATPEERNRLARQLFGQVVIANRTAVAIVPRPDLRPFFASLGSNGRTDTEPAEVTGVARAVALRPRLGRGRRGAGVPPGWDILARGRASSASSLSAEPRSTRGLAAVIGVDRVDSVWDLILPMGALLIGDPDGADRRYATPRARKLSPQHEALIRTAASRGATLSQLAAEHGVSHVTVARIARADASGTQTASRH